MPGQTQPRLHLRPVVAGVQHPPPEDPDALPLQAADGFPPGSAGEKTKRETARRTSFLAVRVSVVRWRRSVVKHLQAVARSATLSLDCSLQLRHEVADRDAGVLSLLATSFPQPADDLRVRFRLLFEPFVFSRRCRPFFKPVGSFNRDDKLSVFSPARRPNGVLAPPESAQTPCPSSLRRRLV